MGISIRPRDISGANYPPPTSQGGQQTFLQIRPPQFEPGPTAREFIVSFSVLAAGGGVSTALFVLDGNGNLVVPSAAVQLPPDTVARISGVSIGGDTNVGAPILTFSIRDKSGNLILPGWEGVGLPGRGGIVAVGLEPYTFVTSPGSFFGGFVVNTDPGPKYAEMMIQGWMW